ncbi:IS256 family transposase, partial [Aliifodinibius salipaludis]
MTQKELDKLQEKALAQLKSGESLFGKDEAFAPMLKSFIESALQAEMEAHLDDEQRKGGNKRNGKGRKTIKSSAGAFEIDTPQDRQSNFDPQLIKKRETVLADSLSGKIIGL